MTAIEIIQQAAAEGVTLTRSAAGTIKVKGEPAAVEQWLPTIRENKSGILAALEEAADQPPLLDRAIEARLKRAIAMLQAQPGICYAVLTDTDADTAAVVITLAIRGKAACELHIPRAKYDGMLLLELIEKHSGTIH